MRITLVLILAMLLGSFSERKCNSLHVIDATKRNWVSGAPGGRSGTNFCIKLLINTKRKVELGNVWLGVDNVPFNLELYAQETQRKIQKGDSVLLTYSKVSNEPSGGYSSTRLPVKYKGEALVECIVDGKAYYYPVKKFRELEALKGE